MSASTPRRMLQFHVLTLEQWEAFVGRLEEATLAPEWHSVLREWGADVCGRCDARDEELERPCPVTEWLQ